MVNIDKGLQIWIPMTKDLSNQGLNKYTISSSVTYLATGGKLGGCCSFNGNCIGVLNLSITQDITIAFWMKPSNTSRTGCLLNYRTSIGKDLAVFLIDGNVRFDAGGLTTFSDYSFTTNWQHVCVVKEGSTKKLYIDGLLKQTVAGVSDISCTATKGTIGQSSTNTTSGALNDYIGLLNDYRYYTYALGNSLIKELSRAKVGHWLGNDETIISNSFLSDISGFGRHGLVGTGITLSNDTCRYDKSLDFNGTEGIGIGNLLTILGGNTYASFTFNCWFKKITGEWSSKNYETIFGGPTGFELEMKPSATNTPTIRIFSLGEKESSGDFTYPLDLWNMLTMVRTPSNTKFYLNGELKATGSAGTIPAGNYFIGAGRSINEQTYRGKISDIRIYATALDLTAINELYSLKH